MEEYFQFPPVSIIIIGHNEADNLVQCFTSIRNMDYDQSKLEIIYVDSNSTDNSVEIAKQYADKVIAKWAEIPTAGLAFNQGIAAASHNYIQIGAGDMIFDKHYLKYAISILMSREDVAVVIGYAKEINSHGWNKIIGYRREEDLRTDDHFVDAPCAGTFRKSALIAVNGYDERIKKGQETELGIRLQQKGLLILSCNIQYCYHNFGINSMQTLINRYVNDGKSAGNLLILSYFEPDNIFFKHIRKSTLRTLWSHSLWILILFIGLIFYWPLIFIDIITYLLYYSYSVWIKQRNKSFNYKLYRSLNYIMNIFNYIGIIDSLFVFIRKKIQGKHVYKPMQGVSGIQETEKTILA